MKSQRIICWKKGDLRTFCGIFALFNVVALILGAEMQYGSRKSLSRGEVRGAGVRNVVVVGGSFGGWTVARKLSNFGTNFRLSRKPPIRLNITMVEPNAYVEYTPSIPRILVEPKRISSIFAKPGKGTAARVVKGYVTKVERDHVEIVSCHKSNETCNIPFDFCVIAAGAGYTRPIRPGESENTQKDRHLNLLTKAEELKHAKEVVIVGGGIVGVEMAADIAEYYPTKSIKLFSRSAKLLPELPQRCGTVAKEWLERRGVQLYLNMSYDGRDRSNPEKVVFWCIGSKNNRPINIFGTEALLPLKVDDTLRISPSVFAVGDIMSHKGCPIKTAYSADITGAYVAKCIKNLAKDSKYNLLSYPGDIMGTEKEPLISCVSLGSRNGLLVFNKWVVTGLFAAIAKSLVARSKIRQLQGSEICDLAWQLAEWNSFLMHRIDIKLQQILSRFKNSVQKLKQKFIANKHTQTENLQLA